MQLIHFRIDIGTVVFYAPVRPLDCKIWGRGFYASGASCQMLVTERVLNFLPPPPTHLRSKQSAAYYNSSFAPFGCFTSAFGPCIILVKCTSFLLHKPDILLNLSPRKKRLNCNQIYIYVHLRIFLNF